MLPPSLTHHESSVQRSSQCINLKQRYSWKPFKVIALKHYSQLHWRFTLQRVNKKLELAELKTKNSRRDLPLIETIMSGLRMHRNRQLQEKMLAGSRWQEIGFVFTTTIGTPLDARNVVRKYHALLKKADLSLHRFHDLRHSCASLLLAKGVPLKTVSDILGHSQLSITADFYAHVVPEMRREAMNLMDSILTVRR
jgi:integrase